MGSSARDYIDRENEEQRERELQSFIERRNKFLSETSKVKFSEDIEWLWENRAKIIANKKLINLIGKWQ